MSKIKFYPVDNGDTVLIKVDKTTIQIDANIRNNDDCYDVMSDLLDEFSKDSEGRYHLDLFMLTHPVVELTLIIIWVILKNIQMKT